MDPKLYELCKNNKLDVKETSPNLAGVYALLSNLEKQQRNTLEFYQQALEILFQIPRSVQLKYLDENYAVSKTYQQLYLGLLLPILELFPRDYLSAFVNIIGLYGKCLKSSDVEIILSAAKDYQISDNTKRQIIYRATYTDSEMKNNVPRELENRFLFQDRSSAPLTVKTGPFELLYLYGENIHDLPYPQEVYFSEELQVTCSGSSFEVVKAASPRVVPSGFFGNKIQGVHALIGKNGSGKSSVFEMISNCSIFGPVGYPAGLGQYFLIYKIEGKYYYANTTGKTVHFPDGTDQRIQGEVRICKISNVFDIYHFSSEEHKISQVIDLTTQTIMLDHASAKKQDELRIRNYQKIIQNDCMPGTKDVFDNKVVSDLEQLSSGERARITLFARLLSIFCVHNELKGDLHKYDLVPNYIFMFDEAELYFHPAWQRRIVEDLCSFIQRIDKELRKKNPVSNITILLSSNSPFYMSDLPASSIHRLSVGKEERITDTFGQNIYSLLKDKFFMDEGVVGSFAKKKLDHALKLLSENRTLTDSEFQEIEYLISILGNPVMKEIMEEQPHYLEKKE